MVAESSLTSLPGSQSPFPTHPGKCVHFFPGQPGSAVGYSECWARFRSELNNCSFLEPHSLVPFLPFKAGSPLPELLSTGHGVGPPLQFRSFSSDDTLSSDILQTCGAQSFLTCYLVAWTGLQHCTVLGQRPEKTSLPVRKANLDDVFAPKKKGLWFLGLNFV